MDAAWALYEAYIKLLTGEVDTALVYGFGKSSAGMLRRVLALQTDPYTVAPLWPDSVSIAGLQARVGLDAGKWTAGADGPGGTRLVRRTPSGWTRSKPAKSVDELLARPLFADPLRRHDIAPITDGASAIVLAAGDRAAELRENPAWITGFEHRIETPVLGARDLTTSPSTAASAAGGDRWRRRLDRGGRDLRAVHPPAPDPHRGDRAAVVDEGEPVRRRAGRQPDVLRRPGTHRLCRTTHLGRIGVSGCWHTPPAGLRCNRIWSR